jgi:hypothetical protein
MSDDMTVRILTEIRDEIRTTNLRLDQTRIEVAALRSDMTSEILALRGEIVGVDLRNATRVAEQHHATMNLYEKLTGQLELRDRIERCEADIAELKRRS